MSFSNWDVDNRIDAPSGNDQYQLDSVGLQIGIGSIGVELLGVSMVGNAPLMPMAEDFRPRWFSNNSGQRWSGPGHSRYNGNRRSFNKGEIQQTVDGIPIRNVYITNISAEVERQDMYNIFCCYGQVMSIYLSLSKNDSSRKFAFVTYENPKDAARVLFKKKFQDRRGRYMYANAADSWHQPKEGPNGEIQWHRNHRRRAFTDKNEEGGKEVEDEGEVSLLEALPEVEEGINILNDDCLMHIFSFLSYKEIAGIERVCKRWQALSFCMWKCLHELSFHLPPFDKVDTSTSALEQYLIRCGEGLTVLDLSVKNHDFNGSTLAVVAKYCANLEVLRVANVVLGNRCLAHLGRCCPKLRELVMEGCTKYTDQDLKSLLPKCRELNILEISQVIGLTGKCFLNLEGPITSLKLSQCPTMQMRNVIYGLQKISSSLESLTLTHAGYVTKSHLEELVATVPNLTSFGLSHYITTINPDLLIPISRLSKLVSLDLDQNRAVNDSVIAAIVSGCENLTSITLNGCSDELSDSGLSKLARLRKLTDLDISYLSATNDVALKNLSARSARLKRLICRGCPDLTEEGCMQVVSLCNDLELLDISGCNNVKEELIYCARTSVKMRTNNVPLKIIAGGTRVESMGRDEEVPLLTVDIADLSKEHLRPDFIDDMFFAAEGTDDEDELDDLCERIADMYFDEVDELDDYLAEILLPYNHYKFGNYGYDDFFGSSGGDTD